MNNDKSDRRKCHSLGPIDSPESIGDIGAVLAEILEEVESRGNEGHWLSRASPLVARARLALLNARHRGQNEAPIMEVALRDLVWRVEHAKTLLECTELLPSREEISEILDTADSRVALGCDSRADSAQPSRRQ